MRTHPLKTYCIKNGITQTVIAKKLGITAIYLTNLLSYKRTPSKKLAKRISELTDIPILELLYPDNQKTKNKPTDLRG